MIGFLWVLICFLEIMRKRPAMAWETGFRSMIPLRVSTLLFLKVVGLAVGHKNPAGYTYTQRTTRAFAHSGLLPSRPVLYPFSGWLIAFDC